VAVSTLEIHPRIVYNGLHPSSISMDYRHEHKRKKYAAKVKFIKESVLSGLRTVHIIRAWKN